MRAIDPRTGKIVWDHKETFPFWAGTLSTAGGLLFTGTSDGYVKAFDAKTGGAVEIPRPAGILSSPVTWEADGEQYRLALAMAARQCRCGAATWPGKRVNRGGVLGVQAAAPRPLSPFSSTVCRPGVRRGG
ncbi:MAG: PQQ-binding-like beta-propeller repeat protein [Rivihabitans pingtungensis]